MSFALDIKKFAEKAGANADRVVRDVVVSLAGSIDLRSPVGNPKGGGPEGMPPWKSKPPAGYVGGHFRANWQLGVDSQPSGEIAGIDPSGKATQAKIKAGVPQKAAGHTYYIQNNLPYAIPLEEGHSHQAPHGMVGLAAVEFQSFVDKAVGELK